MSDQLSQLRLKIDRKSGEDDEYIEQITLRLLNELNELDVNRIDLINDRAPANTRGEGEIIEILVGVSAHVISSLIDFLQSWSKRNDGKSIQVTTEAGKMVKIDGYSAKEAKQLLEDMQEI